MLHGIDLSVINPRIGFKLVAGILADNLDGILAKLGFVWQPFRFCVVHVNNCMVVAVNATFRRGLVSIGCDRPATPYQSRADP